jgi:1-acyl-sn-glycerol-3-phosphate acyltransferase
VLRGIVALIVLVPWTVACALPVALLTRFVPRWGDLCVRSGRVWSRVMLWLVGARVRYEGLEHLHAGPAVIVANHQSNVDIWALLCVVPQSARFVAKAELFRIPVFGWALAGSGFVPIDRANHTQARRSLDDAAGLLREGHSLVLFPEGSRSRDGTLGPFKKGAFHLALGAGVPVVPVAISGSFQVMPPRSLRVHPGRVLVRVLAPEPTEAYGPNGHDALRTKVRARIDAALEPVPEALPTAAVPVRRP